MFDSSHHQSIYIGCAGWSLRSEFVEHFPSEGSHLERYAGRFPAVEINSSFYRPHQPATYARWAASVPDSFRFAVKMPKLATHTRKLVDVDDVLDRFFAEATQLGEKLGPILIQLPPSLRFTRQIASNFFQTIRSRFDGNVVFEPRHTTWFSSDVDRMLVEFRIARIAADPAVVPEAARPGGWNRLVYYRLHGAPTMYYSAYSNEYLDSLSQTLVTASKAAEVWCIFDNTAEGAATANALDLLGRLETQSPEVSGGQPRVNTSSL